MEPARTVGELIQVLYAIDAHAKRVRLKSGAYLRGELVVELADMEEVAALSAMEGAHVFVEVEASRGRYISRNCVETRGDCMKVTARGPERPATILEVETYKRSANGADAVTFTVKGVPV